MKTDTEDNRVIIRDFSPAGLGLNDMAAVLKSIQNDWKPRTLYVRTVEKDEHSPEGNTQVYYLKSEEKGEL